MTTQPASNGNRWFVRVAAALTAVAIVAMFAHIVQPSHAVAEERMKTFASIQKAHNVKLEEFLVQLTTQTETLKSIDKRLESLEP